MTFLGLFLFFSAPSLCGNVVFQYGTGIGAGIVFSLLLITYFVQKRMRTSWMGWIMGCYSLSLYFLTTLWYNLKTYLIQNHLYVLGYFAVTGGLSFAFCYRMGPVENPRTLNLIQWTLQLFGLVLIHLSSYHQVASFVLALTVLGWRAIPDLHKAKMRTWYRKRFFRPQIRLLTDAEYMDQTRVETERALAALRKHCQSPKCDSWRTISRLQSPTRFAEFVQGSPHLTEKEVMEYSHLEEEDLVNEAVMTDDESSDEGLNLEAAD